MEARQEDFVFAEHVLRRGFATEEQVQECLKLLERLRGEMDLQETLENILLKKGYLAPAQANVIRQTINPEQESGAKNQIEGYQLLTRLGSGAMGSVYKAHHLKLNIPVALKVLRVDLAKSRTQVERLKREAQLAARLNHPNIVRSIDVGESNAFHYFAMEFVDGDTVRQLLQRGRLREKDALRITRDVARALEHAHNNGVIHRDVKPANIILTQTGKVKLADFGLARGREPSDLTLDQASIGTPQYLAPEQARRAADATPRSDLFSLGASLYHMVTGRPPFSGDSLGEIFQKVLACQFDPPEAVVPDLSLDTVYVIHRLLRFHPRERYVSATELLADLDRQEEGVRIAPAEFKGDYRSYLRRRRIKQGLVGAAAIAVVAVAASFLVSFVAEQRRESERMEACRVANRVGQGQLDRVNTLAQLREVDGLMGRALHGKSCAPTEVPDLLANIDKVRSDIASLRKAEDSLQAAEEEGAPYRELLAKVNGLHRHFRLPGPRLRSEVIAEEIGKHSRKAAYEHYLRIYRVPYRMAPKGALEKLESFGEDLASRYVDPDSDTRWKADDVPEHARALRAYIDAWERAWTTYGVPYEERRKNHQYKTAQSYLTDLIDSRRLAMRKAYGAGLSDSFLFPFEDEARVFGLEEEERRYFRDSVEAAAKEALEKYDPDGAEQRVAAFKPRAYATEAEVKELLRSIEAARQTFLKEQKAALATLEARVRRALKDRHWGALSKRVREANQPSNYVPSLRRRLEELSAFASRYEDLLARFTRNARPQGIRPKPGTDPDAFQEADGTTFTLAGWDRVRLQKLLGFDEKRPGDVHLRGYFLLGESYAAFDPREERKRIGEAIRDFRRANDPLANELRPREREVTILDAARNEEAKSVYAQFNAATDRQDHATALEALNRLTSESPGSLRFTDFVDKIYPILVKRKPELDRLGRAELILRRAAIPRRNFHEDIESGVVTLTFDFKEWWPDEHKVPADVENKRGWLEQAARKYWFPVFESEGWERAEREPLYHRAKHQLLWFWHLVKDAASPGAVQSVRDNPGTKKVREDWESPGSQDENYRFWKVNEDEEIVAIALHNPFSADADWSIEFTVSWDATKKSDDRETDEPLHPGYFAVTAGAIQAGMVLTEEEHGGGFGARLFKDPSLTENIEDNLSKFYSRYVRKDPPPKLKLSDRAYIDWRHFKAGEKYRMRLRRVGGRVIFEADTESSYFREGGFKGKKSIYLEKSYMKSELRKAMTLGKRMLGAGGKDYEPKPEQDAVKRDTAKVFRFVSFLRPRFHEIIIKGHTD